MVPGIGGDRRKNNKKEAFSYVSTIDSLRFGNQSNRFLSCVELYTSMERYLMED